MKTGPYVHGADCWTRTFTQPDGAGKRTFKILVSTAYDAGIVGSEYNGVVVLDEDHLRVVTDKVLCGHELLIQQTFARELLAADWETFAQLVRDTPRFRAPLPEFSGASPDWVQPDIELDNWPVMDVTSTPDGVTYPAQSRLDVINELGSHTVHRDGPYGAWRLAWNIKLNRSIDTLGSEYLHDFGLSPAFNSRWQAKLEDDGSLHDRAREEALEGFLEQFSTYPGSDQGRHALGTEGRSGGWLVLDKIDGLGPLTFSCKADFVETLKEMRADELCALYRTVRTLDHQLSWASIRADMSFHYASLREEEEKEWREVVKTCRACPNPRRHSQSQPI